MTSRSRKRERSVMMSSVIPSARRPVASSPPRLSNGSTAIEGLPMAVSPMVGSPLETTTRDQAP